MKKLLVFCLVLMITLVLSAPTWADDSSPPGIASSIELMPTASVIQQTAQTHTYNAMCAVAKTAVADVKTTPSESLASKNKRNALETTPILCKEAIAGGMETIIVTSDEKTMDRGTEIALLAITTSGLEVPIVVILHASEATALETSNNYNFVNGTWSATTSQTTA